MDQFLEAPGGREGEGEGEGRREGGGREEGGSEEGRDVMQVRGSSVLAGNVNT